MKKIKKLSWIRNLMIISQVLLVIFVVQWIYTQYQEEKKLLVKELNQQLIASKQEVMDSMLVFKIINPMLKDPKGFKIHLKVDEKDVVNGKILREEHIETHRLNIKHPDTFIVKGSQPESLENRITFTPDRDLKKDLLIQGVKLIYKEVNSIGNDTSKNSETLFYSTDTLLLKNLFARKLNKSGLDLKYAWLNDNPGDSSKNKSSSIFIESDLLPKPYGLEVSKYDPYLLKQISPQLFFGIILLILTGLSFSLAYSSLRNQISLAGLRNDFISNISHELKTPVSTVKLAIEVLQDVDRKKDAKVVSEYLDIASIEMNRLETLIDKVMNTSILEDGKQLIHFEKVDLKALLEETIKDIQIRLTHLNATVKFSSIYETAFTELDPVHIKGVLLNLLDNSLKYGNEKPEIFIDLERNNDEWIINIADKGPGIPAEYLDKVFDKFFRVPMGDKHDIKGYGLGLNYASLIMQQHNGSIQVKNLPQSGCIFTLHIPVRIV